MISSSSLESDVGRNTTIFIRFPNPLYRAGGKSQARNAQDLSRLESRLDGKEPVTRQDTHGLAGNGLRRKDLLGLVMARMVMMLGVVTVRSRPVGRKGACAEDAEYHCHQKKSHELSHFDLSPCLLRTLRFLV